LFDVIVIVSLLQEMRELQELQRTLYTFLHAMATHDLSTILLTPSCVQYLDTIMQLLLFTSCKHKDILLRKVRIIIDLDYLHLCPFQSICILSLHCKFTHTVVVVFLGMCTNFCEPCKRLVH